jgi:alcohol dehydrogenase class IV
MPYVLTFNKPSIEKKIVSICDYLGLEKNFESFLNWILDLRESLNIPNKLSEAMDCSKLNLDQLSLMAFEDPSTNGNPQKISREDLKVMYEHSISGKLFL